MENTHGAVLLLVKLKAHICFMGVFLHESFFVFYSLKTWKTNIAEWSCRLKPETLLKVTLLYGCFSHFLNCTNGTKSRNATHLLDGERRFEIPQILKDVVPFFFLTRNSHFAMWSTHFWPIFLFYIPWKHQNIKDFPMFSLGILETLTINRLK